MGGFQLSDVTANSHMMGTEFLGCPSHKTPAQNADTIKRGTHLAHFKHILVVGNLNYGVTEIWSILQTYYKSNIPLLKYASNVPGVCSA